MRNKLLRRCDGVTRRGFVQVGGLTAFGLGLTDLFKHRSPETRPRAKSCILIWLDGGPSHLETFDLKPEAPSEVRGPFRPIKTNVTGIHISELMPKTAAVMDQVAIIRSMTSPLGEHNLGTHYMMTGYKPTPSLEYASLGSVVAHVRGGQPILPNHIAVPHFRVGGGKFSGGGFLGRSSFPFTVGSDPSKPNFSVRDLQPYPNVDRSRLRRRHEFLQQLNRSHKNSDQAVRQHPSDPEFEQAFRLVTSPRAQQAFDLSNEPAEVRTRYGPKQVGQSCLLARRLVEQGVPFVTVNFPGWDTHADAVTRLKDGFVGARKPVGLIPSLDLAFSALIEDLKQTGQLDETLVVVMGEFGRTPKINTSGGRDHWPRVFSVAMAGGGIVGGQVIGSSDHVGESPHQRPIGPADLTATLYTLLGIDPHGHLQTRDGRPIQINRDGKVIQELVEA